VRIDLHSHSNASDGTEAPADVVRRAAGAGLDVLALTDHDTVDGLQEAVEALPAGLVLVPGAEISCRVDGTSMHLLAFLFDPTHPPLADALAALRADRLRRGEAMARRCAELGARLSWDRVREIAAGGVVGRPHVARALVEAGAVDSVADAFSSAWIGDGGRAYVPKYCLDPVDAVHLVRDAGGVPVFAHPRAVTRGPVVGDDVVEALAVAGLGGLEVDHPDHAPGDRAALRGLAARLGLFVTGSSDDHGTLTGHRLGCETTDPAAYRRLVGEADTEPVSR